MPRKYQVASVVLATLATLAWGCGSDDGNANDSVDLSAAIPATFLVTPSVEHVTVTGAAPRANGDIPPSWFSQVHELARVSPVLLRSS